MCGEGGKLGILVVVEEGEIGWGVNKRNSSHRVLGLDDRSIRLN